MMKVQALHVAVQVICNGEEVLTVSGTKERYVVDVWSGNHPFFKVCAPRQYLPSCHRFCLMCACGKLAPSQEHSCINRLPHPSVQCLRGCSLSAHREVVPACDKMRQRSLRRYRKSEDPDVASFGTQLAAVAPGGTAELPCWKESSIISI